MYQVPPSQPPRQQLLRITLQGLGLGIAAGARCGVFLALCAVAAQILGLMPTPAELDLELVTASPWVATSFVALGMVLVTLPLGPAIGMLTALILGWLHLNSHAVRVSTTAKALVIVSLLCAPLALGLLSDRLFWELLGWRGVAVALIFTATTLVATVWWAKRLYLGPTS